MKHDPALLLQYVQLLRDRGDFEELVDLIELALEEIKELEKYRELYFDLWKD